LANASVSTAVHRKFLSSKSHSNKQLYVVYTGSGIAKERTLIVISGDFVTNQLSVSSWNKILSAADLMMTMQWKEDTGLL